MNAALLKLLSRIRCVGFVLVGHGIADDRTDDYIESEHTSFDVLRSAIDHYQDLGFEFISMTELIGLGQNDFRCDRDWVHLTFDDGYRSIYALVYPYLRKKRIPFSLFISTNHVARGERFYVDRIRCAVVNTRKRVHVPGLEQTLPEDAPREERIQFCRKAIKMFKGMGKSKAVEFVGYTDSLLSSEEWCYYNVIYRENEVLTVDQVKELASDELVHIGSHNHNHITLNRSVSEDDILYEMQTSKVWLQENLDRSVLVYCYPGGSRDDFTPSSRSICQELGYELAFTTVKQFISSKTDKYELPRLSLSMRQRDFGRQLAKHYLPDCVVDLLRLLRYVCQPPI